jgi:hypothetical protein
MCTALVPANRCIDIAAERAEMVRQNAATPNPLPVCRECGYPTHQDDMHGLFHHRLCVSCATNRLERMLWKIAQRHGRRRLMQLLRNLAK